MLADAGRRPMRLQPTQTRTLRIRLPYALATMQTENPMPTYEKTPRMAVVPLANQNKKPKENKIINSPITMEAVTKKTKCRLMVGFLAF